MSHKWQLKWWNVKKQNTKYSAISSPLNCWEKESHLLWISCSGPSLTPSWTFPPGWILSLPLTEVLLKTSWVELWEPQTQEKWLKQGQKASSSLSRMASKSTIRQIISPTVAVQHPLLSKNIKKESNMANWLMTEVLAICHIQKISIGSPKQHLLVLTLNTAECFKIYGIWP